MKMRVIIALLLQLCVSSVHAQGDKHTPGRPPHRAFENAHVLQLINAYIADASADRQAFTRLLNAINEHLRTLNDTARLPRTTLWENVAALRNRRQQAGERTAGAQVHCCLHSILHYV